MASNEITNPPGAPRDVAVAAAGPRVAQGVAASLPRAALGGAFIAATLAYAWAGVGSEPSGLLALAAAFGAYMAMNVGANDVANNVGPAVGARAMSLGAALALAAVFEAAGALIAGGHVVHTISSDIVDPRLLADAHGFVWAMMAALLAAALWMNIASACGAPISATHSIVGAIVGAGIAASGTAAVDWAFMASIAASWVVSPLLGGVIAAGFLYLIKRRITYQPDMMQAARRNVPLLVALMAWTFATYLLLEGVHRVWPIGLLPALALGLVVAAAVYALTRAGVARRAPRLSNDKAGVNRLFTLPLVFAAALLSFAHGSNDVANAIGPLVAIIDVLQSGEAASELAAIPWWVMVVGALGISVGLLLYGPRVIRTVGIAITEIDAMRAYCIAMAAALTVTVASELALPVSTTHIAVGAVFGVGLLRERLKARHLRSHPRAPLVKRSLMLGIVATWVVTLPASTLLGALMFHLLRSLLG